MNAVMGIGPTLAPSADLGGYCRAFSPEWQGPRTGLADLLHVGLARRGAPAPARTAAHQLAAAGTVAVVAGQQPAVGGGPLYNLAKALHAVALARRLRATGVSAVAVFWCASDDHDLDEARHADLLQRDGRIQRFHGTLPHAGASLRHQPVSAWWHDHLAALSALPGSRPGRSWWLDQAPRSATEDLGTWFCRLLDRLLGDDGLIAVQAHELRPLWREHWLPILARWPVRELAEVRGQLLAAGVTPRFEDLAAPPIFADAADGRRILASGAVKSQCAEDPLLLSPGAALRPILQQLALPAALYCAGPGELAYHREIGPIYAALGARPPQLVPRLRLELHPAWWRRGLAAWHLDPAALLAGTHPPEDRDEADLAPLDAALATLGTSTDPDRARRLRSAQLRLQRERDRLAASLARSRRRTAGRPALGALRAWLRPRDGMQERSMSLAQAIWQWGPGLAQQALTAAAQAQPGDLLALADSDPEH